MTAKLTKTCTRCSRCLGLSAFGPSKRTSDGLSNWCRECLRDRHRDWRATPKGRKLTRDSQRRSVARNPEAKKEADRLWYERHRKGRTA